MFCFVFCSEMWNAVPIIVAAGKLRQSLIVIRRVDANDGFQRPWRVVNLDVVALEQLEEEDGLCHGVA